MNFISIYIITISFVIVSEYAFPISIKDETIISNYNTEFNISEDFSKLNIIIEANFSINSPIV